MRKKRRGEVFPLFNDSAAMNLSAFPLVDLEIR